MTSHSEAIGGIRLEPWMLSPPSRTPGTDGPDGPAPALNADGTVLDNLARTGATTDDDERRGQDDDLSGEG